MRELNETEQRFLRNLGKTFGLGQGGGLRNSMKRKRKIPPLFLLLSIELRRGLFPSGNLQRVQFCGFVPALGAPPQRLLAKPTPTAPPLRHLANLASEVVRYAVISNRDGPARNAAVRTKCGNEATCFSLHCIATRETASAQLKRRCNAAVRVVHCYCFLPQFSKHGRCAVAEIVPRTGGWGACAKRARG